MSSAEIPENLRTKILFLARNAAPLPWAAEGLRIVAGDPHGWIILAADGETVVAQNLTPHDAELLAALSEVAAELSRALQHPGRSQTGD